MAHEVLIAALIAATLPVPAGNAGTAGAQTGGPDTRYCLRIDPPTGSRIETIQCRTRDEWASLDVDVDQEWAASGVRVLA